MSSTPSINKSYAMIIFEESKRSLAHPTHVSEVNEGIALFSNNGGDRSGNASNPGSIAMFSNK